jgi:hypothetical protein
MYFALELDGARKVVKARKNASIGQVTQQAFGPTAADARVVVATRSRTAAEDALFAVKFPGWTWAIPSIKEQTT